jgi:predicted membrane GTPase involved in stress response
MSFPVTLTRDDMQAFDTLDLLPLRQMVRATGASRLDDLRPLNGLSRPDRFRILRHGRGGQILAQNGLALAEAQVVLRHAYGSSIEFGTPSPHRVVDHATGTMLEPHMFLRIDAPRAHRQELLQVLVQRSAEAGKVAARRDRIVLRMESPLSRLIGLEREVLEATDGAAQILCWLSRYSPASSAVVEEAPS